MKMKIIIVILMIKSFECLNSTNLCLKQQKVCSFWGKCKTQRCSGQFKVRCDFEICSINIDSCSTFKNMLKTIISRPMVPLVDSPIMSNFHQFIRRIEQCTQ